MSDFTEVWQHYISQTETALTERLPESGTIPNQLHQAMRYACLGGGKRFRSMLVYASGDLFNAPLENLHTPASAIEMIHAYSLIHDDLPAMDDDEMRRGQPTCHIEFDEATAILAGDALQSRAFEILASDEWNPVGSENRLRMIETLARASGSMGMAGGQAIDIEATAKSVSLEHLQQMHLLKTGALIEAAVLLGAFSTDAISENSASKIAKYGRDLGLAFQIADDVLDYSSSTEILGKPAGSDENQEKSTYVSLLGLDQARQSAQNMAAQAIESLAGLGDNTRFLEQLAEFVVTREY